MTENLDAKTVAGFGQEWTRFDQTGMSENETREQFERYFSNFPWEAIPENAKGFDLGCGSGRWAKLVAPKICELYCVDASEAALQVAKQNLSNLKNVKFIHASVDNLPFENDFFDFGYSLGVLHHIPNTAEGIKSCVLKLKKGSPFLVYLYYAFDNRSAWFRLIWKISDVFRRIICFLPFSIKKIVTDLIAIFVYFPLARLAAALEKLGLDVDSFPLSAYRVHSFYTMRTDSLDRLGTRLEQRFTKSQIEKMMRDAGLTDIKFREGFPYWCAVGIRE